MLKLSGYLFDWVKIVALFFVIFSLISFASVSILQYPENTIIFHVLF